MLLKDKVALITGAGRGLGQSVALAYARQGARVIAVSRTRTELDRTSRMIAAGGGHVVTLSIDISREDEVNEMASRVLAEFGRLDVLVNNAGRLLNRHFDALTLEDWDDTIAINLRGPFLTCKAFLNSMKAQRAGSIINVSSSAGVKGFALETDYCASKFALEGFSRALAIDLKDWNIAVNTITPDGLAGEARIKPTSMTQSEFDALPQQERNKWHDSSFLTEAFVYLALQDATGATGQRFSASDLSEQIRREGWGFGRSLPREPSTP